MNHCFIKDTAMVKTHPMWNDFPDIQNFLLECLELIIEKTTIVNHDINKSVTDLIDSRGKLLRPAYFYLFSRFGDSRLDQHENMVSAEAAKTPRPSFNRKRSQYSRFACRRI